MLDRNNLQFDIRELAISLPFLEICPFCGKQVICLREILQHLLDHITLDTLEQSRLMRWLSSINYEKNSRLSIQNDAFQKVSIELPVISANLKCLYCNTFMHPESKLMNHVFIEHLKITSQKLEHLKLWFGMFFKNEDSTVKTLYNFVTETKKLDIASSTLLEKLPVFENQITNTCRYCKITLPNASILFSHYIEWHSELHGKAWNCSLCNFKEPDNEKFVAHVYKKHLHCALCKNRFSCFEAGCKHTKGCLRGCPHCHQKFTFEQLLRHLNQNDDLKCPYCNEVKSEVEQLKGHIRQCTSRQPPIYGMFCPLCKNYQFTEEERFIDHIQVCQPWISVPQTAFCSAKKQNQVPSDNFVMFSDIEKHLSQEITDIIKEQFNLKL